MSVPPASLMVGVFFILGFFQSVGPIGPTKSGRVKS